MASILGQMSEQITFSEALEYLAEICEIDAHNVKVALLVAQRYRRMPHVGANGVQALGIDEQAIASDALASLSRESSLTRQAETLERREAWLDCAGHEHATVKRNPIARLGMVSAIDAKWHGSNGYGSGDTQDQAYRRNASTPRKLTETTQDLARQGAPCVACRRGSVYRVAVSSRQRRDIKRICARLAQGNASNDDKLQLLDIVNDIRKLA